MRGPTRAPATTANLGPGFDCAAVALDLWNEVEVTEGGDDPPDPAHIGIRAFGLVASPEGLAFEWTSTDSARARARLERGDDRARPRRGARWTGQELPLEELLARGAPLEGHSDNLAACLAGGACLTWDGRIARLADALPLTPVAVIPAEQMTHGGVRGSRCRREVPHGGRGLHRRAGGAAGRRDRAVGDVGLARGRVRATACTSPTGPRGSSTTSAPSLPAGAVGATLSGSGPTVIVWAEDAEACAAELADRFPDERCSTLPVVADGAH